MCVQKSQDCLAASTVLVTVVPRTVRQEPVFLARRMKWRSGASSSLTSPLDLVLLVSYPICFVLSFFPECYKAIGG